MKFNWGTGIFLFYTVFAASLFFQVFASTQFQHDLVEENYYEKDLAYQSRFDRMVNSQQNKKPLRINYSSVEKMVHFSFPTNGIPINGNIRFYRANDGAKDVKLDIQTTADGTMSVPVSTFVPGRWKVEVEWERAGVQYYDSKNIMR